MSTFDSNILISIKGTNNDLENIVDIPGRTLLAEKSGWSPKVCEIISSQYKLPQKIKDAASISSAVNRFLIFYSTGFIPNTHTVIDVVLPIASLLYIDKAKNLQDLIWSDDIFSSKEEDCGFSLEGENPLIPEDDSNQETGTSSKTEDDILKTLGIDASISDLHTTEGLILETADERKARVTSAQARPEEDITTLSQLTKQFLHQFQAGSLKEFTIDAAKILTQFPISKGISRMHLHLFKVLNFLALTMLRKIIRTDAQMTTSFLKEQYKRNIIKLIPGTLSMKYAPPSKSCIEALEPLSKNDPAISSFLAKLVLVWISQKNKNPIANSIAGASVLTHLAWNGMGILHMVFEICDHFNISWKSVMHRSLFNTTQESWREIIAFFSVYQKKNAEDQTVAWARIVDDSYFVSLKITNHVTLGAVLMEPLITTQGDRGISNAKWAMDHVETINFYQHISSTLTQFLAGRNQTLVAGTEIAAKIVNKAQDSQKDINKLTVIESDTDIGFSADDL